MKRYTVVSLGSLLPLTKKFVKMLLVWMLAQGFTLHHC